MSTPKIPQPPDDNNPTPVDVLSGIALELESLAARDFDSGTYEPLVALAAKARNAAQIAMMNARPRRRIPVCFSHLRELVLADFERECEAEHEQRGAP